MHIDTATRLASIAPSPTMTITALALSMQRAGKDVITLSAGEPDMPPPPSVTEAVIRALAEGKTGYTAVDGTPELKEAIMTKFAQENGLEFEPSQILVSNGGKHSIANCIAALINPGEEVVIPLPYWVSYPAMVSLYGGVPVFAPTRLDDEFLLSPQTLASSISERTRLLILNSPGNPAGNVYSREHYRQLGDVLADHPKVVILCDDIYEHVYWGKQPFCTFAEVCPELAERVITINGVSKAFAMTGFRIGYAGGNADLITGMRTFQSQTSSCPASISQAAAVAALNDSADYLPQIRDRFEPRHQRVYDTLRQLDGFSLAPARGAFYAFPNIRGAMDRLGVESDVEFCEVLLEQSFVALVPGSAFGMPDHVRLSYSIADDRLSEALDRIVQFC